MDRVTLKEGREASVLRRHPWIFSGAIDAIPQCEPGEILPIYSYRGEFLATGYFHPTHSLCGRILSFEEGDIYAILKEKIRGALSLRQALFPSGKTNSYRLINGEGDGIPGLIVDVYNGHFALQIHTYGIERLREFLVEALQTLVAPLSIYEKSKAPARIKEGLEPIEQQLFGQTPPLVEILENGIPMLVSIQEGQKTGMFLDQREMRALIGTLSSGKKVLNCFAYTGGFSLYALQGGAQEVISVDVSKSALSLAEKNSSLSQFQRHRCVVQDVFAFLEKEPIDSTLVILDPPAFAKKKGDVDQAVKGYKRLNRLAFEKMPAGSMLLSCSCSHFVDEPLFQKTLFRAALEAKRSVQILGRHIQAPDHPTSLFHPEGSYLKSFLLKIAN